MESTQEIIDRCFNGRGRVIDSALRHHLDIEDMIMQEDIQQKEWLTLKKLKLGFYDLCREHDLRI